MGYTYAPRHFGKTTKTEKFFKNALIILNTVFVVFGFILFVYGCGGKASTNRDSYKAITENGGDMFQATSNFLIILGIFLLAIGLWGLNGIHSRCKAGFYVGLLIFLALGDVFVGAYSSTLEEFAKKSVEQNLQSTLNTLKSAKDTQEPKILVISSNWNALQTELKCCGVHNYNEWFQKAPQALQRIADNSTLEEYPSKAVPDQEDVMRIPHSCFQNGNDGLSEEDFNRMISAETILQNVYEDGCLEKTVIDLDMDRMQRVTVLMAVSKSLAVVCALVLTFHLRNDKIKIPLDNNNFV